MEKYLLGIDVGTTGTKTMLFSENGSCIAHAYQGYATHTPNVGWREQDPLDWWKAVVDTVHQTCRDPKIAQAVVGISLSVQGGTMVAVDDKYQAVRPAMVWNDIRCEAQREQFLKEVGPREVMYHKTGWNLGRGMNALQIRWMRDNEPENFRKTAMFLSVPDYIAYQMTGIAALDLSNVGINQLGDIRAGEYDPKLLEFAGITAEKLPRIVSSGKVIGRLTAEAAKELGLTTDCVLVSGAHDQYAVALGAGAVNDGDILIGSGTCWVVTAIGSKPDFQSGLAQSVAASEGMWGSLRSLSSGGICLDWLRKGIADEENPLSYDAINQKASEIKAAEDGLFFYPFSGRCDETARFTRGTFVGLDLSHDRFHMARAVMEGVVFQIVWIMEQFSTKPSEEGLILSGGASKSPLWRQLVADISGLPVRIPEVPDLACVGAAILAGVGSGVFSDTNEGYRRLAVSTETILPNIEKAGKFKQLYEEYKTRAAALGAVYGL